MIVLGCETSCDETGLALYDDARGLLAHVLHSQVDLHATYGGVVPELASRDHVRRLLPLLRQLLDEADLPVAAIDAVAWTAGPGLAGALLTGAMLGRSLAWTLGVPGLGVHHLEAHLLAPRLDPVPPEFPFVCLLVSGGHTQLIRVDALGSYRLLGESLDDAAGEAFDKTAKLLGLGYPGGPALSRLAESGDPAAIPLPRPMLDRPGFDFSFSGLKTAVATVLRTTPENERGDPAWQADVAASFEAAIVETLVAKSAQALTAVELDRLVVSGGVSANRRLRDALDALGRASGVAVRYPRLEFCTDNGAMIALVGAARLGAGERDPTGGRIRPRWPLESLSPPRSC